MKIFAFKAINTLVLMISSFHNLILPTSCNLLKSLNKKKPPKWEASEYMLKPPQLNDTSLSALAQDVLASALPQDVATLAEVPCSL
ncbi:hypothetical protein LC040_07875 [Bacillus tianshenii]|nr:hypothetical protein LC040_07875 [Bacillus tianshenii]